MCVSVISPSSSFYEYMNMFNGHLSQGRFPVDEFPSNGTTTTTTTIPSHRHRRPRGLFSFLLCVLSRRKIRTTASVFDYGYFETKFIFYPLRPKGFRTRVRAPDGDGAVRGNHFYRIIIERPDGRFVFSFYVYLLVRARFFFSFFRNAIVRHDFARSYKKPRYREI